MAAAERELYDHLLMAEKQFTPAQANAALPLVRQIVSDLVEHHARLVELVAAYQKQKTDPDVLQSVLNDTRHAMASTTQQRDGCVAELTELGIILRDAATGLVDFPGEIDGERVLLCWRHGEPRVEWWHRESEGFAGRKPLPVPVLT